MHLSSRTIASMTLLFIVAIIVAIFSYNCIWAGDDIFYQYICPSDVYTFFSDSPHIESFSDIIESQYNHYFLVNGRVVAHTLVQLYCGLWGRTAFAITNGIVYILFILGFIRLCNISINKFASVATITMLVMITFDTKYTPSCQIGYIWMFTLIVWWLLLFRSQKQKQISFGRCFMLFIGSIIVGNSQEALTIGLCGALILQWILQRNYFSTSQKWMIAGFSIGLAFLILAPSTFLRVQNTSVYPDQFIINLLRMPIFWGLSLLVGCNILRKRLDLKDFYRDNKLWVNATIILLLMNVYIGVYANRQLFGIEFLAIIMIYKSIDKKLFIRAIPISLAILSICVYSTKWIIITSYRDMQSEIIEKYNHSTDGSVYINRGTVILHLCPSPKLNRDHYEITMLEYLLSKETGFKKKAKINFIDSE